MGFHHTKKCLLLDEQDFTARGFDPDLDLEDLAEYAGECVEDLTDSGFDMDDAPMIEVLGIVSERYDAACFEPREYDACYIKESWRTTLHKIASSLACIDTASMDAFMDNHDIDALEKAQKAHLIGAVDAKRYNVATSILDGLKGLVASGLPGIVSDVEMTCGGDDAAYDVRRGKYPPGTRVIVEYAVIWP